MIKLVKNEFFKIFHKLSTYIVLLIALIFVVITNIIYFYFDDQNNQQVYEVIDVEEINYYIDNYDPNVDSIDDYTYNLALLDSYNLAKNYDYTSWQYGVFMNEYLNLDINYYQEQYGAADEEVLAQLSGEMLAIIQAVENSDWQYFAKTEKSNLEWDIANYQELLSQSNLNSNEKNEYEKMLFISEEQLELVNYRILNNVEYGNDYLNQAIYDIEANLYSLAQYYYDDVDKDEYETVLKNYYENKYILEEKMDTKNSNTLRSVLINFFSEYSFLILVFVIMIAGGMVSDEFSRGTSKSLLTVPYKRSSILTAKYITVLLIIPFIVIFLLIWEFLVGGILLGFDSLSIPVAIYNITSGSLEVLNVFSYFIINFLANLPQLILLATLAFAASVILNSTAFAIAITFCGIIASEIINCFALMYNIKILNYFVTTNWDFTAFLFGGHSVFGLSLTHSIIICIIYLIIMLVVTFLVFMKKDIKNV